MTDNLEINFGAIVRAPNQRAEFLFSQDCTNYLFLMDDLLGWDCKIEVLLFVAVSPIFDNRESPPFQSPIVS